MPDIDEIRKALESLYDRFGQDAVNALLKEQQPRRERFKSERGAPAINRIDRDAFVYILVEAVRLATNQNIKWCCSWLEGKVTIRGREMRGGRMWCRSWDKSESFRRHHYAARTYFRSGDQLGKDAFSNALTSLLFWRHDSVNPRWGFVRCTRTGMHLDFLLTDHGPPTEIDTLFRGIDAIGALALEVNRQFEDFPFDTRVESFVEQCLPFLGSPIRLLQEIKHQIEQRPFKKCAENTAR